MTEDYSQDHEFRKLLARRSDVDLMAAALELARDVYPDVDFGFVFNWIQDRAAELSGPLAHARGEADALRELSRCIAGTHGITGSAESYEQADGSFLHRVIELKTGIPISLSVLYMAVAERQGLELHGVASPGHFLTRYEATEGPLFLDAFAGGKVLTFDEAVQRMMTMAELSPQQARKALEAVGPREIIIRMLNNLKALYARKDNWPAACVVQARLAALQPTSYSERRDLALITLKANRPGQALDLLETCLKNCPTDERATLEQHVAESRKQLLSWN